ncbi:MAG: hypothetical protein LBH93_03910 [Chitinispirillales bacterium]|nr:hypothetical protein [Chitinispirillales bacterium]
MTKACALPDTGIAEFTFEDGFEAVQRSMIPSVAIPSLRTPAVCATIIFI